MKLCDACGRHVRETTCPFCGALVVTDLPRARARGSRAARILGAAAIVLAAPEPLGLLACGGTTEPTGDGGSQKDGSTSDVADDFAPGPMYGAVMPDAGKDADASDASQTTDGPPDIDGIALYGAPPPPKN